MNPWEKLELKRLTIFGIFVVGWVIWVVGLGYVIAHFVTKFW